MHSSFDSLKTSPRAINKQAARIGFFKGTHFSQHYEKTRATMNAPPVVFNSPDLCERDNHVGKQNGRMTARYWFKYTKNKKSSVWVVQCSCGKYEFRSHLEQWDNHVEAHDLCEVCEHQLEKITKKPQSRISKRTAGERLMKWAKKMKDLGLTEEEITLIRQSDSIQTKGKTSAEIREAIYRENY